MTDVKLLNSLGILYSGAILSAHTSDGSEDEVVKSFRHLKRWIRAHGGDIPVK